MPDNEYLSIHKGSKIDEAVTTVRNDNCKVKYGNIIGTLSDQADLQTAFNAKVDKTTTVNGHALSGNITLTSSDVNALPANTAYGKSLSVSDLTISLKDANGNTLSSQSIPTYNTSNIDNFLAQKANVDVNNLSATGITNLRGYCLSTTGGTVSGNLAVTGTTTMTGALTVNNNINGITPTEFNCLDNVSSNIQTQIDNIKTPDNTFKTTLLNLLYPIGTVFLDVTNSDTCPIASTLGGTWTKIQGRYLLASGTLVSGEAYTAGTNVAEGLPNLNGRMPGQNTDRTAWWKRFSGVFVKENSDNNHAGFDGEDSDNTDVYFRANNSNSIYGSSSTVRPKAYVVNVWRRTA